MCCFQMNFSEFEKVWRLSIPEGLQSSQYQLEVWKNEPNERNVDSLFFSLKIKQDDKNALREILHKNDYNCTLGYAADF